MDKKTLTNEIIEQILNILLQDKKIITPSRVLNFYEILKDTPRQKFEKDLTETLNEIAQNEGIDETIFESVRRAFENVFKRYSLLELPKKQDKIFSELKNYHGEENEQFNTLCKYIIEACIKNLEKLRNEDEIVRESFITISGVQNQLEKIETAVDENNTGISNINTGIGILGEKIDGMHKVLIDEHTPTKTTPQSDNEIYEEKYEEKLFLEHECAKQDCRFVTLGDVFVEPSLCECHLNEKEKINSLKDLLNKWAETPDRLSREMTVDKYSVFLLYGKAGVGKSSYTSKIITDEAFQKKRLALELRSHINTIAMDNPWGSIKKCFNCDDDSAYKDTVVILDGLDEVCVLKSDSGFKGDIFIKNLLNERQLAVNNIKILITSRDGYFDEVKTNNNLLTATISWDESQIIAWCDEYTKIHESRKTWAEEYINDYKKLPENDEKDKRREVFCIPIILYICCVREIAIADNSSLVDVYEKAFNIIGSRGHDLANNAKMEEDDKITHKINWQYTKELAYRIFLDGESPTVLGNEGVKSAKEHTKKKFSSDCEPMFDRYFALFPFASEKKNNDQSEGMEFAHKTVTDYFTAVKLYEDYLENRNSPEKLWQGVWNAFRYKGIPEDIMGYLIDLIKRRNENNLKSRCADLFKNYYEGVENQSVWLCLDNPEYDCEMSYPQLPQQVGVAFRNLTYLLTPLGYKNDERKPEEVSDSKYAQGLSSLFPRGVLMDVFCENWQGFRYVNLTGADLRYADLRGANLSDANLWNANLSLAKLINANLRGADLSFADLRGANLRGAAIDNVDWSYKQELYYVFLFDADLPKFDKAIEKYGIKLINPTISSKETGKRLKYNAETNRAVSLDYKT